MKKQTHTIHDAIEPFVQEQNLSVIFETLYPLLSVKGKKEVKEYWKQSGEALTAEAFEKICNAAKEVTGVDIRTVTKRTKETSLAQFLVSFALYHEFVLCKKATLKSICEQYMPSIKHSQILYAVNAIEKSMHLTSVFEMLYKFALAIEAHGFGNTNRRVIVLRASLKKTENTNVENAIQAN